MDNVDKTAKCLSDLQKSIQNLKDVDALIVKVMQPYDKAEVGSRSRFSHIMHYFSFGNKEKLHVGIRKTVSTVYPEYGIDYSHVEIPHEMILEILNKIRDKTFQEIKDAGVNC